MKVLCICNTGNVRSVTLGRILKKRGAQVLCCGVDKAFESSTVQMLVNWADVVYSQKDAMSKISSHLRNNPIDGIDPDRLERKIDTRFDVGPDDWKIPDHPDLLAKLREKVMADSEWSSHNSDRD